jgi:DNA-3-methyladenine glycosylase I
MVYRCWGDNDPLMMAYHDHEWGVPLHDDQKLFEFLVLDAFQAGLSWRTILHKRENFRNAFDNFDYHKIARYSSKKIKALQSDESIIRNRLKINATVSNAKEFIAVQNEFGSFDKYLWAYVRSKPIQNNLKSFEELPAKSNLSIEISYDLKKRGFKFVGPTIIYAFMQAIGMVNDHLKKCFRHSELIGVADG